MTEERVQRRLAAVVAADVVGYSRLMGEDETGTLATLKAHRAELIDPRIAAHNGRIVKLMGDGTLAEFGSVVDAVLSAVDIQREMANRNADIPEERQIWFRVGINVGDVIIDGSDIYGDGVNIAARLETLAEPGGICVSQAVFDHVRGKVDLGFQDLGEHKVKNIIEPVHAYHVLTEPDQASRFFGRVQAGPRRRSWPPIVVGIAVIAVVVAIGVWQRPWAPAFQPASEAEMAYPLPDKPSIAVLPFANMSEDPEQEYFAQGMTDDLITDLSKISGLFVISRNSTFTYKGQAVKIKEVAHELGVRYVLEGSVRRIGDNVRVNAQLIDALSGGHVWADRYDRNLEDIFSLQEQVVDEVAKALSVELEAAETNRQHRTYDVSPAAYDLFLHARAELPGYFADRASIANARRLFQRVVDQAPDFPGGYAGLSLTLSRAVIRGYSQTPDADAQRALELAEKASAIDAESALSMVATANALQTAGRSDEAIAVLSKLVEAAPSHADANDQLGLFLIWAGRADEAIQPIDAAIRLNPDIGSPYLIHLAVARFTLGQYGAAIAAFERNAERGGSIDDAGLAVWAASHSELGHTVEAASVLNTLFERYPSFHLRSFWLLKMYHTVLGCSRSSGVPTCRWIGRIRDRSSTAETWAIPIDVPRRRQPIEPKAPQRSGAAILVICAR